MKDDKTKMTVLLALVAVIIAVGAFQVVGGGKSKTPVAVETKKEAPKATDGAETVKNPQVAGDLPERDPFDQLVQPTPVAKENPPVVAQNEPQPPIRPVKRYNETLRPAPIAGNLNALPLPNKQGVLNSIPNTDRPATQVTLKGVILGPHPAALFGFGDREKVVEEGGSIDGDTRVIRIEADAALVSSHGKTHRITLGGNGLGK